MSKSNKYILIGLGILGTSFALFMFSRGKGYSKLEKRVK